MAGAYFVPEKHEYGLRWLFSAGSMISLFFITSHITQIKAQSSHLDFETHNKATHYIGIIKDYPEETPKTHAYDIKIKHPIRKKIKAYIEKDESGKTLTPGSEIIFKAKLEPFKNLGNPDGYNYEKFMHYKGYAATTFIPFDRWRETGKRYKGIRYSILQVRQKAITFLSKQELDADATGFITALTLGYKDKVSPGLRKAFNASGTAHVLAVSGLHVGIIYSIITVLLSFLNKRTRAKQLKHLIIIIVIWIYAILTGLSPSVVRASIMLSIITANVFFQGQTNNYNTLFFTAFVILICSPFSIYDIGFQMSFLAVFSILFFSPHIKRIWKPKHRISHYIWDLFTISLSAQLGVFPLSIHYFGTFPTYFFIANILIIPLIGLIIYTLIPLFLLAPFSAIGIKWILYIQTPIQWFLKLTTNITLQVVYFIETLPFSQIENLKINSLQTITISLAIYTVFIFSRGRKYKQLVTFLTLTLISTCSFAVENTRKSGPQLVLFNTPKTCDIALYIDNKRYYFNYNNNGFIPIPNKRILLLSDNFLNSTDVDLHLKADIIILSKDTSFSIQQIVRLFKPKVILLDNTIPSYTKKRWKKESESLGVQSHDVADDGAFIINL